MPVSGSRRRVWLWVWVLWATLSTSAWAAPAVPPVLRDWVGWALHGHEHERCPTLNAARGGERLCAWPGGLALRAEAEAASFAQTWEVLERAQEVPLPGDARWRPEAVVVEGRPVPVLLRAGRPMVYLHPGRHRVAGRIVWSRRPASLAVPDEVALIALSVDGRSIERIERQGGALVLGEAERHEADSLSADVARLLVDGLPGLLLTRLELTVAGRPRELRLGPALPEGHVPMALGGDLPVRLDADGRLRIQARAGTWEVLLAARAPLNLATFELPAAAEPWPEREVLQFRPDARFRLAQASGLSPVDPAQFALPDWEAVRDELFHGRMRWSPAEMQTLSIAPGQRATLEVRQRGLPEVRTAQLHLQRTLWLDFDGGGYSALDRILGDLGSLRRLDMAAPWRLQRAVSDERDLLIVAAPDSEAAGVEVRALDVDLTAAARLQGRVLSPGWTQPFGAASFTLNLPPGYRLLAATGAERALGSWWDAWSLLDIFLVSLAALLAWRLGRWPSLALVAGYALLAWHEPGAPRVSVLIALALALALTALPEGRWRGGARTLLAALLALVLLMALPFAAGQLKLALYPQLEYAGFEAARYDAYRNAVPASPAEEVLRRTEAPVLSPEARKLTQAAPGQEAQDMITVTGARIRRADLFGYPADAVPQAGTAMPDWRWHRHELRWSGPLLPDDDLGLWLAPPWATRLWRLFAVLLLAGLLARLFRPLRADGRAPTDSDTTPAAAPSPSVAPSLCLALVATLAVSMPVGSAQARPTVSALPDAALLDTLRDRLLEHREPCHPHCLGLGAVVVRVDDRRVEIDMEVHAQADGLLRLPRPDGDVGLIDVRLDGAPMPVRGRSGEALTRVSAGVRQVRATYAASGRIGLRFPSPPVRVRIDAPGFAVAGLDDGRLIGDTLTLTPPTRDDGSGETSGTQPMPPFVRVSRYIDLDREWRMRTEVERLAPVSEGFETTVDLLPGERIVEEPPPLDGGRARIAFPAGVGTVSWQSRLPPSESLTLTAGDGENHVEVWHFEVSPLLHVEYRGLPLAPTENGEPDGDGAWIFLPLPGERVVLTVSRPTAVAGATLALEDIRLHSRPGARASEQRLGFRLRSTRAGDYRLALPEAAELLSLTLDGVTQPALSGDDGALVLPVAVGTRQVELNWRRHGGGGVLSTPDLNLGASSADLRIAMDVPHDRWLLWLSGPGVGPALLIWPQLLLLLGLAIALARWGGTPLRTHQWLLLGLGFAAVSWAAAMLIAGWLLALAWRGRQSLEAWAPLRFNLLQLALIALTLLALVTLLGAIPAGLLGRPDMGVVGNGSDAGRLNWFLDRSVDGHLPSARAYTLPLWLYKAALLAWSLWLAQALLRWLRWGWQCGGRGGFWRPRSG